MTQKQLEDIEAQLREAIQQAGLALNEIERRCGVSHAVLSRFMRGERSLTLPIAGKLCLMLGLRLCADGIALDPATPSAKGKRSAGQLETAPDVEPAKPRGRPRKDAADSSEGGAPPARSTRAGGGAEGKPVPAPKKGKRQK